MRILTVCTHNRTRSVMMAAMLQSMLDERLGPGRAMVRSAGVGPPGEPAISDAVASMRERGLDVSAHRSRKMTAAALDGADLVLTAERDHVVRAATISRDAFGRAMTLPEFIERSRGSLPPDDGGLRAWVEQLTADRSPADYLREAIDEIEDPTGSPAHQFAASVEDIERQCRQVADVLAGRGSW